MAKNEVPPPPPVERSNIKAIENFSNLSIHAAQQRQVSTNQNTQNTFPN